MTFRRWRFGWMLLLCLLAYDWYGSGGAWLVFLASVDLTITTQAGRKA